MRERIAVVLITVAFGWAIAAAAAKKAAPKSTGSEAERRRVETIHRAVFADPFDEHKLQSYFATLPRLGERFIVEGDVLMTEQQVRAYVVSKSTSSRPIDFRPELLVDTIGGQLNYYADPARRMLTFAVDRQSFGPNYGLVVDKLAAAAKEWEEICPECAIHFVHDAHFDDNVAAANTNFVVRQEQLPGYIALAFFPADPPAQRILRVDPSYFTGQTYDKTGVFRHEIGHVLGYRHEQIRSIAGCYQYGSEGNNWAPLTEYDAKSVMHYPCGATGTTTFKITPVDVTGHRSLYGLHVEAAERQPATATGGLFGPGGAEATRQRFTAAFANPFDEAGFGALLERLPRDGEYYVVEGDILMTADEVRKYVVSQSTVTRPTNPTGELLVNSVAGAPDFYKTHEQRQLTYAIDRSSLPDAAQYWRLVENMKLASKRWQDACVTCDIAFIHNQQLDDHPQPDAANFIVRLHDSQGSYLAAAFFPHDPPQRRFLNIDPMYFQTQASRVGVLRHELGHVLGYRHEHIRGISGCYREGGQWLPLTPYDPKSVMHYLCGGAGTLRLDLTGLDRLGHQQLYALSRTERTAGLQTIFETADAEICQANNPNPCVTFVVQFEGGDIPKDIADVLRRFMRAGVVRAGEHVVVPKDTIETIYISELNLPGFAPLMRRLAAELNPRKKLDDLTVGERIRIPLVKFTTYDWTKRLDTSDEQQKAELSDIKENWGYITKQTEKRSPTKFDVKFTGWQLKLAVTADKLPAAEGALASIDSRNVIPIFPKGSESKLYSVESARDLWRRLQAPYKIDQGREGFLGYSLDLSDIPNCLNTCKGDNCPEVVLFDVQVRLHADVKEAIQEGGLAEGEPPTLLEGNQQAFIPGHANKDVDHGTQIAGIVGSRQNGFGLIGINPHSEIYSLDWLKLKKQAWEVQKALQDRFDRERDQIFIFASDWDLDRSHGQDPIVKRIIDLQNLWIVAAGDKDGGGENITVAYPRGPMNLGDQRNVIVVTSCGDCFGRPYLMQSANYSTDGLVSLAAPGDTDIPTTISGGQYDTMGGTSQATAFVGAVASAMMSCWPNHYRNAPERVKFRLLLTSKPSLPPQDMAKVSAGVINAALTVEDPTKSYLDDGQSLRTFVPTEWCTDRIKLRDPLSGNAIAGTDTANVFRVMRDQNGDYYVYASENPNGGNVTRLGPGVIADPTQVLIRSAADTFKAKDIRDLVLARRIRVGQCR